MTEQLDDDTSGLPREDLPVDRVISIQSVPSGDSWSYHLVLGNGETEVARAEYASDIEPLVFTSITNADIWDPELSVCATVSELRRWTLSLFMNRQQ